MCLPLTLGGNSLETVISGMRLLRTKVAADAQAPRVDAFSILNVRPEPPNSCRRKLFSSNGSWFVGDCFRGVDLIAPFLDIFRPGKKCVVLLSQFSFQLRIEV